MKKSLLLIFFVLLSSFSTNNHETYLSVTEIDYNAEEHSLEIVSRVFINDLEDVLSKRYQKEISLSYKKDLSAHRKLMEKYLHQKLLIEVDGEKEVLHLLGSKFDADQLVLFIEVKDVQSFSKVKVENLVLTDLFDSQKNIVHVKKGDKIESMLLMKESGAQVVSF